MSSFKKEREDPLTKILLNRLAAAKQLKVSGKAEGILLKFDVSDTLESLLNGVASIPTKFNRQVLAELSLLLLRTKPDARVWQAYQLISRRRRDIRINGSDIVQLVRNRVKQLDQLLVDVVGYTDNNTIWIFVQYVNKIDKRVSIKSSCIVYYMNHPFLFVSQPIKSVIDIIVNCLRYESCDALSLRDRNLDGLSHLCDNHLHNTLVKEYPCITEGIVRPVLTRKSAVDCKNQLSKVDAAILGRRNLVDKAGELNRKRQAEIEEMMGIGEFPVVKCFKFDIHAPLCVEEDSNVIFSSFSRKLTATGTNVFEGVRQMTERGLMESKTLRETLWPQLLTTAKNMVDIEKPQQPQENHLSEIEC